MERILEPLTGILRPDTAKVTTGRAPVGEIAAGWHPGKYRYQDRIMGAGQLLRIAQRLEATRRAARADDDPTYAGHDSAPSSRLERSV
jgi:hypothetical protein